MANQMTDSAGHANGVATDMKSKLAHTEHQLEAFAKQTGERVGEVASQFASSSAQYLKSSTDFVKENPVKGVAIAAGVGLVAGSLITLLVSRSTPAK